MKKLVLLFVLTMVTGAVYQMTCPKKDTSQPVPGGQHILKHPSLDVCATGEGTKLFVRHPHKCVQVWDLLAGYCCRQFYPSCCMAISPSGEYLALGSLDGVISLYNTRSLSCVRQWHAHPGRVENVSFSPDEKHLHSSGAPHDYVWEVPTGSCVTCGIPDAITAPCCSAMKATR